MLIVLISPQILSLRALQIQILKVTKSVQGEAIPFIVFHLDIKYFMHSAYHFYILTNKYNTVLYTGVTSDIYNRVLEHKDKVHPGFTAKYNVYKLVYFEGFEDVNKAIAREKQIKAGSRQKKLNLINYMNPNWEDLWEKEFGNVEGVTE
jgi:putative endonuclease